MVNQGERLDALSQQLSELQETVKTLVASQDQRTAALEAAVASQAATTIATPTSTPLPVRTSSTPRVDHTNAVLHAAYDVNTPQRSLLPASRVLASPARAPHWTTLVRSPIPRLEPARVDHLPFSSRELTCADGSKSVTVELPVVACAAGLEQFVPYHLDVSDAYHGVPRPAAPAASDRRHVLAVAHLQKDSPPKSFELQFLGSAVSWYATIVAGIRSLVAAQGSLPPEVFTEQLVLALDALELNISNQVQRLRYLSLPGEATLAEPTLRDLVVRAVGRRQTAALQTSYVPAPLDVDRLTSSLTAELSVELDKADIKAHARAKAAP